jgi:DNA polymerase I
MHLLSSDAIRRCLVADQGHHIISADFDQIELRVAAGLAGEQILIDAAKRGESLHKATAIRLFGADHTPDQYRYTKNVNFGWLFGGGAATLSKQAGIPVAQAKEIITDYENTLTSLTAYKRRMQKEVLHKALHPAELDAYYDIKRQMWSCNKQTADGRNALQRLKSTLTRLLGNKFAKVETPFGRELVVEAAYAFRVVNYIVQATARDIMAKQFLAVMDDPWLEATVLLLVHDEILGQAPIKQAEYFAERYAMVMTTEFMGVPITAEGKVYGPSWGDGYTKK